MNPLHPSLPARINRVPAGLRLPLLLNALVLWAVIATTLFGQGLPIKGARIKFSGADIKEVFQGDPKLPGMIAGHIVVLGVFANIQSHPESTANLGAAYQRVMAAEVEKIQDKCKKFAREFASGMRRYQDNGVYFLGISAVAPGYTKPAVLAHAQELKFTAPIVQVEQRALSERGLSLASVVIFDHLGLHCYEGKLNDKAEDAIRKAMREMAKPKP